MNNQAAVILISIAFAVVCAFVSWAMAALRRKLQSEQYVTLLDRLDKLATIVVLELEQTVVQPAKQLAEDGKLSKEVALKVKQDAVTRFMAMLGDKDSPLRKAFGDLAGAAETLIEAKVRELRLATQGRKVK